MFFGSCIASGNAFLIYLESTGYWIIREDKTTPKVIVFSISFISLSGRVATSATESAPLIPPIMITCLHAPVVFSFVKRCVAASIGYVDAALAAKTAIIASAISGRFCPILAMSMFNPRYKKATEFAKNAIISQKFDAYALTFSPMMLGFLIITPNHNPAAAAATSPEKPSAFEITTEPNNVATDSAVSENGSSISLCKNCEPTPRPTPTAMPPKNTHAKCPIVSKIFTLIPDMLSVERDDPCDAAIAIIEENIITPVASLKLASDSINVASVFGIFTPGVAKSQTRLSDFTFTFHFPALEKDMATHSSVLALRIPGTGEPGGLPSMGSHRVGHD